MSRGLGDVYKRQILAIAAGHASGSSTCDRSGDRAVSQECKSQWETSGGGGSSWKGSPDCRWRRARSGRASILMGCGPSPPRRSPADVTTSPASRSISSSSVRRLIHKPSDQEVEFALRSWTRTHGAGVRVFFSRLREQPCRCKLMPADLELLGAGRPRGPNMTTLRTL